jgi:hypothetical protein
MSQNELVQVTEEFTKQNSEYAQVKKPHGKGGPVPKHVRDARRDEVHRLHFEYAYSARKIAKILNTPRPTIDGDIDYWYSKAVKNTNLIQPEIQILGTIERLHSQVKRLREELDKVTNNSERMKIERLIYDLNSKLLHTYQKITYSFLHSHQRSVNWYNETMKKKKMSERATSLLDIHSVSEKAYERISKILNEDRQRIS